MGSSNDYLDTLSIDLIIFFPPFLLLSKYKLPKKSFKCPSWKIRSTVRRATSSTTFHFHGISEAAIQRVILALRNNQQCFIDFFKL